MTYKLIGHLLRFWIIFLRGKSAFEKCSLKKNKLKTSFKLIYSIIYKNFERKAFETYAIAMVSFF